MVNDASKRKRNPMGKPTVRASIPAALRDIRAHLKKDDVDTAIGGPAGWHGGRARGCRIPTFTERRPAKRTVLSEPDHTTRVACARLILEYGFGKPVVQQRIEIDDGEGENTDTPQAIAERIREGGVDMRSVLDVYADGLERVESAE